MKRTQHTAADALAAELTREFLDLMANRSPEIGSLRARAEEIYRAVPEASDPVAALTAALARAVAQGRKAERDAARIEALHATRAAIEKARARLHAEAESLTVDSIFR